MSLSVMPIDLSSIPECLASIEKSLRRYDDTSPCIYFLVKGGTVVYVGQSINLGARLGQHRMDGKEWDETFYYVTTKQHLRRMERRWMRLLRPVLNKQLTPKKWASKMDKPTLMGLQMPGDLVEKIDAEAERLHLSRSAAVRQILLHYFGNADRIGKAD